MRAALVSSSPERPDPTAVRRTKRDILVVDDTAANLLAIEAALAPLGNQLVLARSGEQALARVLEQDFALILLDVQMPGMDGYECARLIRSRERSKDVPIIFITAYSRDEDEVMRAYQLGAVDFLFKPVHPDVLRAKAAVFVQLLEAQETKALRAAAEEMARLNAELAAADRRKDEFLAILSHELRNPLAPIETSLELIRRNPDRPVPPRVLEVLGRQTRQLTRLVDDLLDISRITNNKIELRTAVVCLDAVVEDAVLAVKSELEPREHKLVTHPPPSGAATMVRGDQVRLIQVVVNLLNNAARYTAPGGRIDLAWGIHAGEAFVRVTDNGRGIPPALLDRVFDMFVQERAGSDGEGGLGLGLALVRRLVELHGGKVSVSSPGPSLGSTFEVRMPSLAAAAPTPSPSEPTPPDAWPVEALRPLRAVVIDDNPDLRELVADLLSSLGHDVETADDGPAGLALIRESRPDVALVDIGLPGLDGYGVARAVRRELADHHIRLVAMTGYGQDDDRIRALAAGFDVHIIKPATAATILSALHE